MQPKTLLVTSCAFLVLSSVAAYGAGKGTPSSDYVPAFTLEEDESDIPRITLKDSAVKRLGIKTSQVTVKKGVLSRSIGGRIVMLKGPGTDSDVHVAVPRSSETEKAGVSSVVVLSYVGGEIQKTIASRDDTLADSLGEDAQGHAYYKLQSGAGLWKDGAGVLTEFTSPEGEIEHLVVPYSSLLYDKDGGTWVYLDEIGSYKRHPVEVAFIEGDEVFLTEGPPIDSPVVSIGAVELLGIENEVGF